MSNPTMGMAASKKPKTRPVLRRVCASTPERLMPMAAAKFERPRDTLTNNNPTNADMGRASFQMAVCSIVSYEGSMVSFPAHHFLQGMLTLWVKHPRGSVSSVHQGSHLQDRRHQLGKR